MTNRVKRWVVLSVAALLLVAAPGCGTLVNQDGFFSSAERDVLGGVGNDLKVIGGPITVAVDDGSSREDVLVACAFFPLYAPLGVIDLPFSLIGDLVMLPSDVRR